MAKEVRSSRLARYAAAAIDGVLVTSLQVIVYLALGIESQAASLLSFVIFSVYSVYFVVKYRTTPGKKLFGLRIVSTNGKKIDWISAFLREVLGKTVSGIILGIGYLMILVDKDRQGLHDKLASTKVIQEHPLRGLRRVLAYFVAIILPLIIVGGIVAAIAFIAANPSLQFLKVTNAERRVEITRLQNALEELSEDAAGLDILGIYDNSEHLISSSDADICTFLVPDYLESLPVDPEITEETGVEGVDCEDDYDTGYTIQITELGNVRVDAPRASSLNR